MKKINDELKRVIENDLTSLARCWKITTKLEKIIGFTTSSENFEYENILFNSFSSNDIENLTLNLDIENDKFEFSNIFSNDLINANDILLGKYDGAKIEIFIVDLNNLNKGKISLLNGKISNIEFKDNIFIAKVNGLKNEINKSIGSVYSPLCRVSLCSKQCGLNKNNYSFNGIISKIIDFISFSTEIQEISSKANSYFNNGTIEFISGENKEQKIEIKQFNNGIFILSSELPYKMNIGDDFIIIAGCDKQFKTCCEKFNNAKNFRGEPHLPGIDLLLKFM